MCSNTTSTAIHWPQHHQPPTNTCQHPKHPHRLVHAEMNSSNASSQWNDRLPCVSGFVGGGFRGWIFLCFFCSVDYFLITKRNPIFIWRCLKEPYTLKNVQVQVFFGPQTHIQSHSNSALNLSCMHCSSISELLVQSTDLEVGNCQLPILHATQSTHELHATHGGWVGYSSPTTNRRFHGVLEDPRIFKNWMV